MNFSSSVMTGMGISLGSLEIATDFLYANSDMYEPELTEVKATISHKICRPVTRVKPVRPKTSTQNILNKFTLIPANKQNKTIDNSCDEIIDDTVGIVEQSDDFDFSFDDIKDKKQIIEEQQEENEALANDLLSRLQNNKSTLENSMEDDFNLDDIEDEDEFALGDIRLDNDDDEEDNGSFDIDTIESLDEESDEDDIEFDLGDDENEEDDIEFDTEDEIEFDLGDEEDEDDIEFDLGDEEDSTKEISKQTVQKVESKPEIKVKPKEIDIDDIEEDEDDIEFDLGDEEDDSTEEDEDDIEFDIDNEDEIDFDDEIDLEEIELPTQNEKPKQINNIEKQSSIKDTQPKIEGITKENQIEQKPSVKELQMMEQIKQLEAQVQRLSANNAPKQESEHELMSHIRQLEAQIQNLSVVNTCEPASNVENKSIKKGSSLNIPSNKPVKAVEKHQDNKVTNHDMYSAMQIDALYKEVREFAIELGVRQKPVEIAKLEEKFGAVNIRKLVNKSYIIKIGKGATIGR